MDDRKKIHIITGGTVSYIAPHLALCAPAYGQTGTQLARLCTEISPDLDVVLHRTKMAGGVLETNEHVAELIEQLKLHADTKIVFMPVAMCDFEVARVSNMWGAVDLTQRRRLKSSDYHEMGLVQARKIIPGIRVGRKDIFLVGFKTTDGATEDEQYIAGLHLLKEASCNLVLVNDIKTRLNMVVTPEEARYHVTFVREDALRGLVEMAKLRSHLTFTRSTVVAGEPVPWSSALVPDSLRAVVDWCIAQNAFKPFRGATVGHFAVKFSETEFLTSQRKTNFNELERIGLVRIKTDGPDTVLAYGSKPSVGGQSQRIVFSEHPEYDCIVHFHCPLRPRHVREIAFDQIPTLPAFREALGEPGHRTRIPCDVYDIPVVSQREYECGSHQCGQNTSRGLRRFGNLSCVMLDQHGPNIVFHHSIDPQEVIGFIQDNFDLSAKTGGYVSAQD